MHLSTAPHHEQPAVFLSQLHDFLAPRSCISTGIDVHTMTCQLSCTFTDVGIISFSCQGSLMKTHELTLRHLDKVPSQRQPFKLLVNRLL